MRRSHSAVRTRFRLGHLILLVPCWEGETPIPKKAPDALKARKRLTSTRRIEKALSIEEAIEAAAEMILYKKNNRAADSI